MRTQRHELEDSIAATCSVNEACLPAARAPVTIGDNATFAIGVMIITNSHTIGDPSGRVVSVVSSPVTVEDSGWTMHEQTTPAGVLTPGLCASIIIPTFNRVDRLRRDLAHLSCWARREQDLLEKQYRAMNEGAWSATPRQFCTGNASVGLEDLRAVGAFDYVERDFSAWKKMAYVASDYAGRNPVPRKLVRAMLTRPRLRSNAIVALSRIGRAADRFRSARPARYALSAVYGMLYHQGFAEQWRAGGGQLQDLRTAMRRMA